MEKEKLRKVAMLAQRGEDGEREAANRILKSMGTTSEEVLQNYKMGTVDFVYKDAFEKQLGFQIAHMLAITNESKYYQISNRKVRLVIPEHLKEKFSYTFEKIKISWRKEIRTFHNAFINRNELFSGVSNGEDSPLTQEEIEEIIRMSSVINRTHLYNALNENSPSPGGE